MKIQALIMAGLLLVSPAIAQTQKGNGILSGSVSINYNRLESPAPGLTTLIPAITLTAGRFWTDNWLAGFSVSGVFPLSRQRLLQTPDQTYPSRLVSVGVTPFVRRYWQFNAVYLFAGAGLSVNIMDRKQPFYDSNGQFVDDGQKSSSVDVGPRLEAGVNYFLTNRLGLQLVASASSLPLNVASLNAGLVYWTGSDRRANASEVRTNAQTDPGRWVLEGSFNVNTQNNSQIASITGGVYQSTNRTYSFYPSAGFFIKKNSLIGISIPVSYYVNRISGTSATIDNNLWGIGLSPYFQHYWTSTRLTPYTRVDAGYTRYNSGSYQGNSISGGLIIGLAYMAGNRFIIETSLGNASVNYLTSDPLGSSNSSKLWNGNISAGLTGNFALRYVLQ